jgi:streptogramin lyase
MDIWTFPVLAEAGAHDVYPAPDGTVWFTAQSAARRQLCRAADAALASAFIAR